MNRLIPSRLVLLLLLLLLLLLPLLLLLLRPDQPTRTHRHY